MQLSQQSVQSVKLVENQLFHFPVLLIPSSKVRRRPL